MADPLQVSVANQPNPPERGLNPEDINSVRAELEELNKRLASAAAEEAELINKREAAAHQTVNLEIRRAQAESILATTLDKQSGAYKRAEAALEKLNAAYAKASELTTKYSETIKGIEIDRREIASRQAVLRQGTPQILQKSLEDGLPKKSWWKESVSLTRDNLFAKASSAAERNFGTVGKTAVERIGLAAAGNQPGIGAILTSMATSISVATTVMTVIAGAVTAFAGAAVLINKAMQMFAQAALAHTSTLQNVFGPKGGAYIGAGYGIEKPFLTEQHTGYSPADFREVFKEAMQSGFMGPIQMSQAMGFRGNPQDIGGYIEAHPEKLAPISEATTTFMRLGVTLGLSNAEAGKLLANTTNSLHVVTNWRDGLQNATTQILYSIKATRDLAGSFNLSATEAFKYLGNLRAINVQYGESFIQTANLAMSLRSVYETEKGGINKNFASYIKQSPRAYGEIVSDLMTGVNLEPSTYVGFKALQNRGKGGFNYLQAYSEAILNQTPVSRAGTALSGLLSMMPAKYKGPLSGAALAEEQGMLAIGLSRFGFSEKATRAIIALNRNKQGELARFMSGPGKDMDTDAMQQALKDQGIEGLEAGDLKQAFKDPLENILIAIEKLVTVFFNNDGRSVIIQAAAKLLGVRGDISSPSGFTPNVNATKAPGQRVYSGLPHNNLLPK